MQENFPNSEIDVVTPRAEIVFVDEALIQFRRRLASIKDLEVYEVIPLVWAFEIGSQSTLSPKIVIESLKLKIQEEELSLDSFIGVKKGVADLHLANAAFELYTDARDTFGPVPAYVLDIVEHSRSKPQAKEFVAKVVLPYVMRGEEIHAPKFSEFAALGWGYQVGGNFSHLWFDAAALLGEVGDNTNDPLGELTDKLAAAVSKAIAGFGYTERGRDINEL